LLADDDEAEDDEADDDEARETMVHSCFSCVCLIESDCVWSKREARARNALDEEDEDEEEAKDGPASDWSGERIE
jgi:hypothetical protein